MSKEFPFMIYCVEEYGWAKKMDGKSVVQLFEKYSVFEYIRSFYEALHTTSSNYIVSDIDLYIQSRIESGLN